ncbi:DUF2793 domain-containing protein [Falsochrobactrum sp. TDYN1]|uniref:DUF2793 domain-containing protein n=1 Tax=Falsochrobactrum tianjinense TaxID=2706015 RepID=A0A949UU05_9HYPH|nr:DUF2793 domain-containing protein [Falsochrobactrum sp. TDYN1]MBV2142603.1 DUF2793 domain-containing protein [Falsochrobactrum sp. TDYN1]
MDQTPNLKLPYILPSQAQKHVTHNEALRLLDAVVHLSVRSRMQAEAPETPLAGERYIVASSAVGSWGGKDHLIASYIDGGWLFVSPAKGWLAYIEDEAGLMVFNGINWEGTASVPDSLSLSLLGVQATADAINRFAVSSEASLFNNAGAGHQVKVNKQASTDTASLLFQANWTGHAEMGLNGDNNFSIKVGDDSGNWREAVKVDHATGNVAVGSVWPQTRLHVDGPIRPASYSVAGLPSAAMHGAGAMVFVTDAGTGAQMVCSDGSVWRDMRAGAIIA